VSKNSKHFRCAVRSRNHLSGVFGLEYLWIEDPLRLCSPEGIFTEPEPDLAVLAHPAADYAEPPEPGDVRLLIEIADSTLDFDLGQKADRYAASSLADYWVLDVKGRRVIVHRDPVDGKYTSVLSYAADELVAPLAAPDAGVLVRELFAPEEAGE
jgi:Uma2 family endonuclease